VSRTDHVYVAGFQDCSAVKVGASANPSDRVASLRSVTGRPMALFWSERVRPATFIEGIALGALEPNRIKGEWFAVSPEAAIAVAKSAIARWVDPATGWLRDGAPYRPHEKIRDAALLLNPLRHAILARLAQDGPMLGGDLAQAFARSPRRGSPLPLQTAHRASVWAKQIMRPMVQRRMVIHDDRVDAYAITEAGRDRLRRGPGPGGGHPT